MEVGYDQSTGKYTLTVSKLEGAHREEGSLFELLLNSEIISTEYEYPLSPTAEIANNRSQFSGTVEPLNGNIMPGDIRIGDFALFCTEGALPEEAELAQQLISPGVWVSRSLFLRYPDDPRVYAFSFGGVEYDENDFVINDPRALNVNQAQELPPAKSLGTMIQYPDCRGSVINYSEEPYGGHSSRSIGKRQQLTELVRDRLGDYEGIALPTNHAVFESSLLFNGEPVLGLMYSRPEIIYRHQIFELCSISGDVNSWAYAMYKMSSAMSYFLRRAEVAHMQPHGSNMGLTLEEEPRVYVGDCVEVIDLKEFSNEESIEVSLDLKGKRLIGDDRQNSEDPVLVQMRMTPRISMIHQSLYPFIENCINVGLFQDERFRLWSDQIMGIESTQHDFYLIYTLLPIYLAFIRNEEAPMPLDETLMTLVRTNMGGELTSMDFVEKLIDVNPDGVKRILRKSLEGNELEERDMYELSMTLTILILQDCFGAEITEKPKEAIMNRRTRRALRSKKGRKKKKPPPKKRRNKKRRRR
jgi:hypothetical protein